MEGVPELVCDRVDRAQRAVEVGEHTALTLVGEVPAEGAAALSWARVEVDPTLVEGSLDKLAELGREAPQVLDQVRARRLDGKRGGIRRFAHDRGEEIPPRKTVFVPKDLRFALEVGLKRRQMLRHDLPQHVERLASHPRLEERHIERGREPAHLRLQDNLLFDAVKRRGNADRDGFRTLDFGIEGLFARLRVGRAGEVAQLGEREFLPIERRGRETDQARTQVDPRISRAPLHAGENVLRIGASLVSALEPHLPDYEAIVIEEGRRGKIFLGELNAGRAATNEEARTRHLSVALAQGCHRREGLLVARIDGAAQVSELMKILADQPQLLLAFEELAERLDVEDALAALDRFKRRNILIDELGKLLAVFHIRLVLEAFVERIEAPLTRGIHIRVAIR